MNIKGLIRALTYKKLPSIRVEAARALGELEAEETIADLIQALNDGMTHHAAKSALRRMLTASVPELIRASP